MFCSRLKKQDDPNFVLFQGCTQSLVKVLGDHLMYILAAGAGVLLIGVNSLLASNHIYPSIRSAILIYSSIRPSISIHSTELLGVSLSLCLCCTLARFSNVHCNIRFFVPVYLYFCICICAVVFVYLYSSALAWFSNIHCTLRLFALAGPYTAPARCQSFNISQTKRRRKDFL